VAIQKSFVQLSSCYRHRASVKFAQNKIDECIKDCTTALQYDPKYSKAYLQRSICHLQRGNFKDAQEDIIKAQETDPLDQQIVQHMQRVATASQGKQTGDEHRKKGRWQEAYDAYKILVGICPGLISSHLGYAEAALLTKNVQDAAAAISQVLAKEPNNIEALWIQTRVKYHTATDVNEALDNIKVVLKLDPGHTGATDLKKKK